MKVKKTWFKLIVLFVILLSPALLYIGLTKGKHNLLILPVFGPKEASSSIVNNKTVVDTIYHTIPAFSFTDQNGTTVTEETIKEKIVVVEYFFSKCMGICPKMRTQLIRVQGHTEKMDDIILLSFTVDPENDTIEALNEYAQNAGAIKNRWHFLTGEKKALYGLARKGFFLGAQEGDKSLGEEAFLHSDKFVLIDKEKRIRGYYTGTDIDDVDRLIDDIKLLKASEFIPRKSKSS
ncbi:MAG TPA: SCO family protein [Flavobacteriales bacterium]|nr:SCO family protein [Flavobacteriales bacterium]HIN39909.1 SCO family protein [Flavobacteriales bacterium]